MEQSAVKIYLLLWVGVCYLIPCLKLEDLQTTNVLVAFLLYNKPQRCCRTLPLASLTVLALKAKLSKLCWRQKSRHRTRVGFHETS